MFVFLIKSKPNEAMNNIKSIMFSKINVLTFVFVRKKVNICRGLIQK